MYISYICEIEHLSGERQDAKGFNVGLKCRAPSAFVLLMMPYHIGKHEGFMSPRIKPKNANGGHNVLMDSAVF